MTENWLTVYKELAPDISEILITPEELQQRVREMGAAISQDYAGRNPLLVGVLKGVVFFMADLLRVITIPVEVDFIAVSRNRAFQIFDQAHDPLQAILGQVTDRHVLLVEDVVNTGLTLNYILRSLRARKPASLEVCVLFNKPEHRLVDIPLKYTGFDLPDRFVVGYGLDYREKYRHLPFVGPLNPQVLQSNAEG